MGLDMSSVAISDGRTNAGDGRRGRGPAVARFAGQRFGQVAAVILVLAYAAFAFSQEPGELLGPKRFDIPEMPLVEALRLYSVAAGIQVMFETKSAAGYRSVPVVGEFTPEAALRVLLADTDLKIRYVRTTAITLSPAAEPSADDPPAQPITSPDMALEPLRVTVGSDAGDRLREYIGTVQADIQKALRKLGKARQAEYRVGVRLWVDQARTVQRAELFGSSGDRERDNMIAATLQGLVLSRPAPANTPQPMRVMIAMYSY
jgi:hypothetical protein